MYALANVEKFLDDHPAEVGEHAPGILARARQTAQKGLISGHHINAIMGDGRLARFFRDTVTSDPSHIEIGFAAMRKSTKPTIADMTR